MTVANCTTPANYFHLLRRQALAADHRPLVVFTPKSLLRHRARGLAGGGLHLGDVPAGARRPGHRRQPLDPASVKRVLLCSGKVFYDLRRGASRARAHRHRDPPAGAAPPVPGRPRCGGARRVPERRGPRVGPGGAGQPGRLELRRAEAAGAARRRPRCGACSRKASASPAAGLQQGARAGAVARSSRRRCRGRSEPCTSPTRASRSWPSGAARRP